MNDSTTRYRAPALDKGLDILELLSTQPVGLTRAEIVKAMGRSASEIYRMLERLVARDYVTRSLEGDRYSLSLKLFLLGHRHPPLDRLLSQALPHMEAFAKQAEQSCHLVICDQNELLVAAQVNGPGNWGLSLRVGAHIDMLLSGSGLVYLAYQTAERRIALRADGLRQVEDLTMTSDELDIAIAGVLRLGYWQGNSRQAFGVIDLSAPVLDHQGHAIAVLSCPYVRRVDQRTQRDADGARELLVRAANALSVG